VQHRELERATLKDNSTLDMVVSNLRGLSIAERTKLWQVGSFKKMLEVPIQSFAACEQDLESALQGNRISKQGQEAGEVGFVPTGSFELAPE
jgi:hypothetical protein